MHIVIRRADAPHALLDLVNDKLREPVLRFAVDPVGKGSLLARHLCVPEEALVEARRADDLHARLLCNRTDGLGVTAIVDRRRVDDAPPSGLAEQGDLLTGFFRVIQQQIALPTLDPMRRTADDMLVGIGKSKVFRGDVALHGSDKRHGFSSIHPFEAL